LEPYAGIVVDRSTVSLKLSKYWNLIGVYVMGIDFMDVRLIAMHLTGVYLIGVYFIGIHLMASL
jgi:hypothetical protein